MAGVALGGATERDVANRLDAVEPPKRRVVLTAGARSFWVSSGAMALRLHPGRSAARALDAGRDVSGFLLSPAAALGLERTSEPVYAINRRRLARAIDAVAKQVDIQPFEGAISIDPATFAVDIEPPRDGRRVDRATTARAVERALLTGPGTSAIEAPMRMASGPSRADVESVADEAREYLAAGPLRLRGAGPAIVLEPAEMAPLLSVESLGPPRSTKARLGLRQDRLGPLLAMLSKERSRAAADAIVVAAAQQVTVEGKDDVDWRPRRAEITVRPARAGRSIDIGRAADLMAGAIAAGDHDLRLPVRRPSPELTTAMAERVGSLIGTFTTRFPCCEARVTNIKLIAQAVDGAVMRPGQQFSLNDVAGPRTRARGFLPAPFISDGKIVPSVGGGVSQFSTTMYNAAYFAGLRLDAHQPHSFYIDRYPPGREATLDFGSIDLTWTNDTPAPVLVRASTTDTSVTVDLFGANGGRRVSADAGPRQPVAGRDFSILVTRVIQYGDGRVVQEPHTTTYDEPPAD